LHINKIHYPITSLGYGLRIGLWTQGCSIRCRGCINADTWQRKNEDDIPVVKICEELADWFRLADGLTVSGGEPFDQPEDLRQLLVKFREFNQGDRVVFSGYSHQHLFTTFPWLSSHIDVLISEPFDGNAGQTLALRGSDNQRIFLLSDLALKRYAKDMDLEKWGERRPMDAIVEGDTVWLAGIPAPELLPKLRDRLRVAGYLSSDSSSFSIRA
jgi:anaerobic ribonucleoside-triphosphate reductase activating protein